MVTNEELMKNDPDLLGIVKNFFGNDIRQHGQLDTRHRLMVSLASCIAVGGHSQYRILLQEACEQGLTPIELKELLYHCTPYAGLSRVSDFITETNDILREKGAELPSASQTTTTLQNRLEKGLATQKAIFGPAIDEMYKTSPSNQLHIQKSLSANCFGDYYTRTGLSIKDRELITFSILAAMGGCEAQLKGHIAGNVAVGNNKSVLLDAITQILPYIGYPRTLNAISCLNTTLPEPSTEYKNHQTPPTNLSAFPIGSPNPPANSQYFTGKSYLAPLTHNQSLNVPVYSVTFEPACRNNWHSHSGGQILIVVGGEGLYQEEGKTARRLHAGDVVEIAPDVVHWHGATPQNWFSHLAITCNPQQNESTWLAPVNDEQYEEAAKKAQ